MSKSDRIPRDRDNDHTREMASQRATFVAEMTGSKLDTVASYTIDPAVTRGNIENFTGTAQVPLKFTYQVPTAFRQFAEQYSW